MSELSKGWVEISLQNIGKIQTGNTPSKKEENFYGGELSFFKPGDLNDNKLLTSSSEKLSEEGRLVSRIISPNSIYVTCIGATIGKTGFIGVEATCNQQINTISPYDPISSKLIYYFVLAPQVHNLIISEAANTTLPILNKSKFSGLPIRLPPLAEQKRIVEKLDQVLAQVDTIKARLDGIPAILKRFRQSVLAAAVSGKLTGVPIVKLGELNQCASIVSGLAFKKSQYSESGSRLLQIANVGYGKTKWDSCNFIPLELAQECNEYSMADGDIVLALNRPITNDTLKVAWVESSDLPATLYQRVARIRCKERGLKSEYLFFLMQSPKFLKLVELNLKGSDQPYLNTSDLASFDIYAPSEMRQTEIVRLVDQYFAFADTIEKQVQKAQQRVDKLTQSILAKAFRGELVPQDPTDEPADELLKRIAAARAESEALAKAAKKVGKKTGKS